jgi:hypothetical protein
VRRTGANIAPFVASTARIAAIAIFGCGSSRRGTISFGKEHAHAERARRRDLPALNTHHVTAGFAMSTVTQPYATVVTVRHALTVAAAKGVITKRP